MKIGEEAAIACWCATAWMLGLLAITLTLNPPGAHPLVGILIFCSSGSIWTAVYCLLMRHARAETAAPEPGPTP